MKVIEQRFHVVLFIMFYKVVLTFKSVDKPQCVTIQMKAIEQCFHVLLFIMLYKVVLTFKSVDETLVCNQSNESYWAVLSCGTVYYAAQGSSNVYVCGWNPSVWPSSWKLLSSTVYYVVDGKLPVSLLTCCRILVVSNTPVYLSCFWTLSWSNLPATICSFGRMHLLWQNTLSNSKWHKTEITVPYKIFLCSLWLFYLNIFTYRTKCDSAGSSLANRSRSEY